MASAAICIVNPMTCSMHTVPFTTSALALHAAVCSALNTSGDFSLVYDGQVLPTIGPVAITPGSRVFVVLKITASRARVTRRQLVVYNMPTYSREAMLNLIEGRDPSTYVEIVINGNVIKTTVGEALHAIANGIDTELIAQYSGPRQ